MAEISISSTMAREIDSLTDGLDGLLYDLERWGDMAEEIANGAAREAAKSDELRDIAGKMLAANYDKSGLNVRTGTLREACENPGIFFGGGLGKQWRIVVALRQESNQTKMQYDDGKSVYLVANAQQYGYVKTPKLSSGINALGKRAKQTLKKIASGQAVTKQALTALRGRLGEYAQETDNTFSASVGRATVIPPKRFWFFDGAQQTAFLRSFFDKFENILARRMGLQAA